MKIKFSGVSCGFNSTYEVELFANIKLDSISIDHETDELGGITHVYVNGDSLAVKTETFKIEIEE